MRAVNPNAQPEVQRVLDYLEENRGNRLILGQHTQTMEQPELEHIRRITGKLPALCGFELLGYSPNIRLEDSGEECMTEVVNARGTLRKAWEWARLGGLITFTWHWFSPLGGRDKSFYSENTDFSASRAAQSGTPENAAFLNDLDYMAGLLRSFSDEHTMETLPRGRGQLVLVGTRRRGAVQKALPPDVRALHGTPPP